MASSNIINFYNNKNIFITGATGFVGICLLEKILRSIPNHGKIYLLLRPKKGNNANERLDEIKKNQVFEKLLQNKSVEELFRDVYAISGEIGADNLAISPDDREILKENINVVVHLAATLDFADPLKLAVNINLLGTRRLVTLAKECRNLNVFVHVSSAYVNSFNFETTEIIYDKLCDSEELIQKVTRLSEEELEIETPKILGEHPNSYTMTKHLAEHEVKDVQELFPCTIVRPSMIVGAWKEPSPGWTISKNGPQGFLMGASKGVIRRLPLALNLVYDYIPVDIVVNNILAAGYNAGSKEAKEVEVYHCTSSTRKPFTWSSIEDKINPFLHEFPLKSAVWYPYVKFIPSLAWYRISAFIFHIIPAFILDTVIRVCGGRPILMRLHRNVNSSLGRLEKFIFTEWKFHTHATTRLHNSLSQTDQELFGIEICHINWVEFFRNAVCGARVYLSKDPLKTLPTARTKNNILWEEKDTTQSEN